MKRLTLTGITLYALTWAVVIAAYFLAWLTDFDRGN